MDLKQFDYKLDKKLIAQVPTKKRENSKLLIFDTGKKLIEHKKFFDIINYFKAGDVLVLNNSKVIPARLIGKKETGGQAEIFLLQNVSGKIWECLLKTGGNKTDIEIDFKNNLKAKVVGRREDIFLIEFNKSSKQLQKVINKIGLTPLPPYIKNQAKNNKTRYQTVYADEKKLGSVAAPTAGLHFTKNLLNKLKKKGVQIEYVTLHVGLGTFQPVKVDNIKKHQMHAEQVEVSAQTLKNIIKAKQENKRVIAVGTTSVRVLESVVAKRLREKKIIKIYEAVNIFIYPGIKFKVVDAMITNFHLPKSTLLMLVSAFLQSKGIKDGIKEIKKIYKIAQAKKYRFFSYGDVTFLS